MGAAAIRGESNAVHDRIGIVTLASRINYKANVGTRRRASQTAQDSSKFRPGNRLATWKGAKAPILDVCEVAVHVGPAPACPPKFKRTEKVIAAAVGRNGKLAHMNEGSKGSPASWDIMSLE